jgi:hypothetical protein
MPNIFVPGAVLDNSIVLATFINTWNRLEPLPISTDLTPSLQARVADPLWLLCRQWQFQEFVGEDAGTPIEVNLEAISDSLDRFAPGQTSNHLAASAKHYDSNSLPLEVWVESESIRAFHPRLAAESGQQAIRLIKTGLPGAEGRAIAEQLRSVFPLELAPDDESSAVDEHAQQWRSLVQGRGLDGGKLANALKVLRDPSGVISGLPEQVLVPTAFKGRVTDILSQWLIWYEEAVTEPSAENEAWLPRRMEYAFSTGLNGNDSPDVLVAREYVDGRVDWDTFDAARGTLGSSNTPTQPTRFPPTFATPVEFAGKPADRYWEFEDAAVHLGVLTAGPTDITKMLMIEFSLIYGNDWFIAPMRLPVGSFTRITKLAVKDTFGVPTKIERSRERDVKPWSLFELSRDSSNETTTPEFGLWIPPVLAKTFESKPLEEIAMIRDEMANMVWGVEHRVQGLAGSSFDRKAQASKQAALQRISGEPVDAKLIYRLATQVPEHWIPYIPIHIEGSTTEQPVISLQRRSMLRTEVTGERKRIDPAGLILKASAFVEEEEITRDGVIVTRSFQYGRWFDGRSLLWVGKRKGVGRGEGFSGLKFDIAIAQKMTSL